MKKLYKSMDLSRFFRDALLLAVSISLGSNFICRATIHTVQVSNSQFTPNNFNAGSGDTVKWVWVSGFHTTTSTTIPVGATPWDAIMSSSSTTFLYPIPSIAGTYNYKCTPHGFTGNFVVTLPCSLSNTISTVDVTCNGGNDGSMDLTVSGAVLPLTYLWNTSATSEDLNNITAGAYSVTVTDANGCSLVADSTVNEPPALALSFTITDNLCQGDADGKIYASVSGGTPPYQYNWSIAGSADSITNLYAGTYSLTVTDSVGCTLEDSTDVFAPEALSISIAGTDAACSGDSNGTANLTLAGSVGPFSFTWSTADTTEDPVGLSAGNYYVTVTGNACFDMLEDSVTITEPPVLVTGTISADAGCNGLSDGSVDLTVSGGTPPYGYSWSIGDSTENLANAGAGVYYVTVEDANGCTANDSGSVSEPPALNYSIASTGIACNGDSSGSVDLSISDPGVFNFYWSSGDTTEDIGNLSTGTYYVTITDSASCNTIDSTAITQPAAITVSDVVTDVSCNGNTDGVIDLTISGGTAPYTFNWSNTATTEDISGLSVDTYDITLTDTNGCSLLKSYSITNPPAFNASFLNTDVTCYGDSNGTATAFATGAPPIIYIWSTGDTTSSISGLPAGVYDVTVTDNCDSSAQQSITINQSQPFSTAIPTGASVACAGDTTATIELIVSNGINPLTYLWSNGQTIQDPINLGGGTYIVTVTDSTGCMASDTGIVNDPPLMILSFVPTPISCFGYDDGAIDLTVTNGNPPLTYSWTTGDTIQDLILQEPNTYTVTVTDSTGCTATGSSTVATPANIIVSSATLTDVTCNGDSDGTIILTISGGVGSLNYDWSTGDSIKDLMNLAGGNYFVTVTDSTSCTGTASFNINDPAVILISGAATDISCYGSGDGMIGVTASGGTGSFTYYWNGVDTIEDLTGLSSGNYDLIVTDANGCVSDTANYTIIEPVVLSLSTVVTDVSCNGNSSGIIDLSVTGGTGTYTYTWSNGSPAQDIGGLDTGMYSVTVTDGNDCSDSTFDVVNEPALLVIDSVIVNNASCPSCCDGDATANVLGGTGTYTYDWNDSLGNNIGSFAFLNGLCPADYYLCVTDSNGCIACKTISVSYPVGFDRVFYENGLTVFPNPGRGKFQIQNLKLNGLNLEIYNLLGEKVFQSEIIPPYTGKSEIDFSSHSKGIYFIHWKTENSTATQKLIIY